MTSPRWETAAGRWLVRRLAGLLARAAPHWVLLTGVLGGMLVAALMAAGSAELYEAVVEDDGIARFDRPVLDAALAARSPGLDVAVTAWTDGGGQVGMPILATVLAIGLGLWWRSWSPVLLLAVAATGSLAMTVAGKVAVGRGRPRSPTPSRLSSPRRRSRAATH